MCAQANKSNSKRCEVDAPKGDSSNGMSEGRTSTTAASVTAAGNPGVRFTDALGRLPDMIEARADSSRKEVETSIEVVLGLFCNHFEIGFDCYRRDVLRNRVANWLAYQSLAVTPGDETWAARLSNDDAAMESLHRAVMIGTPRFVAPKSAAAILPDHLVAELFHKRPRNQPVRVWVVGCASGEEAYSIAMCLSDAAKENKFDGELKIIATDRHSQSVRDAVVATYSERALVDLEPETIDRYFDSDGNGMRRVAGDRRKMMVISHQDVLYEAPFLRLDLVLCRGLLSMLAPAACELVLQKFHYALSSGGHLVVGEGESTIPPEALFESEPQTPTICRRIEAEGISMASQVPGFAARMPSRTQKHSGIETTHFRNLLGIYDELLGAYVESGFLINRRSELVHSIGDSSQYLATLNGRISLNLVDLVHPGLCGLISSAIDCRDSDEQANLQKTAVCDIDGKREWFRVTVRRLGGQIGADSYYFLGLASATQVDPSMEFDAAASCDDASNSPNRRLDEVESELRRASGERDATLESLEFEVQKRISVEHELQRHSDELIHVQQELQAVSEELSSVESEHRAKSSQLMQLSHDFDELVTSTGIAVMFLDEQQRVRSFTPAITNLFSIRELDIGRPVEEIPKRFSWPKAFKDVQSVLNTQRPVEHEVFGSDGAAYVLQLCPCQTTHDGSNGVSLRLESIDTIKRMEAAFQIGAENQWQLLDSISDAVWITSSGDEQPDGTRVLEHVNPSFNRIWGISRKDLEQDPGLWRSIVHEEDRERTWQSGQNAFSGGQTSMRYRIVRSDGDIRWIEHRIHAFSGGDGLPDRVCNVARDLTEQKRSDKQFSEFVKNAQIAAAFVHQGAIVLANGELSKLMERSIDELEGSRIEELIRCGDDMHDMENPLAVLKPGDQRRTRSDALVVKADGSTVPVEAHISALDTTDGPIVLMTFHDLTALRRSEAQVERTQLRLRRAIEDLDEFTYAASHDLREPLRKISAFSQLLPKDIPGELPERAQLDLEYVIDGAMRMQKLIEGLLILARCGRNQRLDERVNLSECVVRAQEILKDKIDAKNAVITSDELPHVNGNAQMIACLFMNLIDNALKFSSPGVQPQIHVTAHQADGWVFGVRDNGVGINPRYNRRIFGPFKRLASQKSAPGAGIGLAICRKIVQRHCGNIWVESSPGAGAHFKFTLGDELER